MKFGRMALMAVCVAAAVVVGCSEQVVEEEPEGNDLTEQAMAAAEASGYKLRKGGDGGVLRICSWSDYLAPDVVKSFERALGVKVIVDAFISNEAMYAKLKKGGVRYDIVVPSSYQVVRLAKEGLLDVLDPARIPNVRKNFDPSFKLLVLDSSFRRSVPYTVTCTGFMYAKGKMPAGADVNSWAILGHPAMKGHITLLDDGREVIGGALMFLGYSVNSKNPKEIDAATAQVLKWLGAVRRLDGENYKTDVPGGTTWLGLGYSTDTAQIILGDVGTGAPPREDIGFALPREGFSIALDELAVVRDAPRKDLAYAFINYVYDGDVAAANMNFLCGPSPVLPGIEQLDDNYRQVIIPDEETLARGQVLRPFDDPAVVGLYDKAWKKIKAAASK